MCCSYPINEDLVENVLTFGILCWECRSTNRLRKIPTTASKMLGTNLNSLEHIHRERSLGKIDTILANPKHPLFTTFKLLPSGGRFCYPTLSLNRTKQSFIPRVIAYSTHEREL